MDPLASDPQLAANGMNITEFITVLEQHRLDCEKAGKYEEALLAKTRLDQLRYHEDNRKREEVRAQQLAERLGIEEAHMKELQEFNEIWDRKVAEFEAHASTLEQQLGSRHTQEHQAFVLRIQNDTQPRTPKWSRELLNLRRVEQLLARQKKYQEAGKVKQQADALEGKEYERWKAIRDVKIATAEEQFLRKQELEMAGLIKRIASGREEQKQARKTELDRLLQRYHNVKHALETQHHLHRLKVEKYPYNKGPSSGSMSHHNSVMSSKPMSAVGAKHSTSSTARMSSSAQGSRPSNSRQSHRNR